MREYEVPVIIDVTADSPEAAAKVAVEVLGDADIVGKGDGSIRVESWWTVEKIAKPADRNDNDHGVVLFKDDLDYLHQCLVRRAPNLGFPTRNGQTEVDRYLRLLDYLDPKGRRCGSDHQKG